MCGIAGIWHLDGRPVLREDLERFTRSVAHRGPDGEGYHLDDGGALGLGHRRLAILDLSAAGTQPLGYADGRYWVTFNGEVYNFLELRHELEGHGYRFHTQTDTEVIAAAYDRWGPDCQLKLNGMWAFALWDGRERTLFLSRDRFGIKPLHYLFEPGKRFAFGSELKTFFYLRDFAPRDNEQAIRYSLVNAFSLEGTEQCLLEGVNRLRGGHCLLISARGLKTWRWWNTLDHLTPVPSSLSGQAERFRELFFDSCRLRLRSDVPVGTSLSGGLDSSAVLCSLAAINSGSSAQAGSERRTADWQRAFIATFPGTALDERAYAEIAVEYVGAMPCYLPISPHAALAELQKLIYDFEEIYIGLPTPAWMIYRELRRSGVTVSLDGHGADELLGGYPHLVQAALDASGGVLRAPGRALDLMHTQRQLHTGNAAVHLPSYFRMAVASDPLLRTAYPHLMQLKRRLSGMRRGRTTPEGAAAGASSWVIAPPAVDLFSLDADVATRHLGKLNATLYREFHSTVLPTILRNFDRCSMAHGIEIRMPFMDWRLVCFCFSLPETSKIGGGFTKRILRESMRGVMPEDLRLRKGKIGFNSPLPEWFNGPLREWVTAQVHDRDFLQSNLWNGPAICRYVEDRQHAGAWMWDECQRVWPFLHAHAWRRTFLARSEVQ